MKKFDSIFDILGPDMVGPSSSHTAGAARIGNVSKSILNDEIIKIKVWLYNSFASTGKGHGTDKAIIAGVLGIEKSNPEIKNAFNLAKSKNIKFSVKYKKNAQEYPANYAVIELYSRKIKVKVEAESLGGALIIIHKIDGFDVNINGEYETLIITHKDKIGILSQIYKFRKYECCYNKFCAS
jgi:L-serine dehydratase